MSAMNASSIWFAVIDSRQAHLLEMRRLPSGRLHLDARSDLVETWDEKQHHRPYMLSAAGRSYASTGHEEDERLRRFGKQVASWLEEQMAQRSAERVVVLSSAAMISPVRTALPHGLVHRVEIRKDDLAGLNPAELTTHPAVLALLE